MLYSSLSLAPENLGFAIPINLVREVAEEIIKGSTVTRAWLGIEFQEIKQLRVEREILSKAAAWFAQETDALGNKKR